MNECDQQYVIERETKCDIEREISHTVMEWIKINKHDGDGATMLMCLPNIWFSGEIFDWMDHK